MENVMVCRICFVMDAKLYDMYKYCVNDAFANLSGYQIAEDSICHVCSYCGTMLNKFKTFRNMCIQSQQIWNHLLAQNIIITTDHVKSIHKSLRNISPYTVQLIHHLDTNIVVKDELSDTYESKGDIDISEEKEQKYKNMCNNIPISNSVKTDNDIKTNDWEMSYDDYCDKELSNLDDSDEEPLSNKVKIRKRRVKTDSKEDEKCGGGGDVECDKAIKLKGCVKKCKIRKKKKLEEDNQHKLVILSREEQMEDIMSRRQTANYKNAVYRCESCYKGFAAEGPYHNHMLRHDPRSGAARCAVCGVRCADARALRAHSLGAHERKYICQVCGEVSRTRHKSLEHAAWHRGATFPCGQCGASFARSTSYLTHARLHHPSAHRCPRCGGGFLGAHGLRLHMKKAHRDEDSEASLVSYDCDSCHFKFKNKQAMARHLELTGAGGCHGDSLPCLECGDLFPTEPALDKHLKMHRKEVAARSCSQCSRTFASARTLAAHARTHTPAHARARTHARSDAQWVCEICGYNCVSKASLVNHQRTHTGEKPFGCTVCHKRFSVYQRLQIHFRTHTDERPFRCDSCPKAFRHKAALNRHTRVHTGVKPYSCPHCGKAFSQSNSMKQHCAGVHMKSYLYARKPSNKQPS